MPYHWLGSPGLGSIGDVCTPGVVCTCNTRGRFITSHRRFDAWIEATRDISTTRRKCANAPLVACGQRRRLHNRRTLPGRRTKFASVRGSLQGIRIRDSSQSMGRWSSRGMRICGRNNSSNTRRSQGRRASELQPTRHWLQSYPFASTIVYVLRDGRLSAHDAGAYLAPPLNRPYNRAPRRWPIEKLRAPQPFIPLSAGGALLCDVATTDLARRSGGGLFCAPHASSRNRSAPMPARTVGSTERMASN
jgi:hypothetical protein